MTEMRRCKECGKLFVPKGREQYCSNIHYRPCPICGDPVEVKYLSDPPRRCAKCRTSKRAIVTSNDDSTQVSQVLTNEFANVPSNIDVTSVKDIRKFIGKDYKHGKGYLPGHLYEINIDRDDYSYIITASYDLTDEKEVNITELFSSNLSINGHFEKLMS